VLSTNGATQYLSDLAAVPAAQPGQQYLPLAGGQLLGGVAPSAITLADAAAVTPNGVLGNDFTLTMTSAVGSTRTVAAATPLADRQNISLLLVQPASGGPCSVSWAAAYDFGSAGQPGLSAAANAADLVAFKWDAGLQKWLFLGSQGGY
jgi:hypothetical protein